LLGTPPDNLPPVASYFFPDISSTTSDECSQRSLVLIKSCVDSQHKKPFSPKAECCLISFSGPQFETGTKEPFLGYTSRVRPLYPSYPCVGPFPNLSHTAFCESTYYGALYPAASRGLRCCIPKECVSWMLPRDWERDRTWAKTDGSRLHCSLRQNESFKKQLSLLNV
jgi:hypothetical protein